MSVRSAVSALAFIQNFLQAPDITKNFMVAKALKGFHRLQPTKEARSPVTLKILEKLVNTVSMIVGNNYNIALFKAMYSLAFFGFLRIGEITAPNGSQTNHQLQLSSILIHDSDGTMTLIFHSYKHKQDSDPFRLRLHNTSDSVPVVKLMCKYLKLRGFFPGPLFILQNGKSVSRKMFSQMLMENVKLCCTGPTVSIRPHSFRIGAATHAIEMGYNDEQVRLMGRWRTQAFRNYIRNPVISFTK